MLFSKQSQAVPIDDHIPLNLAGHAHFPDHLGHLTGSSTTRSLYTTRGNGTSHLKTFKYYGVIALNGFRAGKDASLEQSSYAGELDEIICK
eukprot:gene4059-4610_t